VIGCLCVTDKLSRAPFSGNDLEILQILASQAGIALANAALYEKATIDTLTRVYVRRHFMQRLEVLIRNAHHQNEPLSLVMIDLDHFKAVNDTYGHQAGDAVLKALGRLLKRTVRHDQVVARYGGEEFAVILPGVEREVAARVAERIRASIEEHEFKAGEGLTLRKTASLGVATLSPGESREQLIARADEAMYAAKQGGRNRVVVAPAPAPPIPPPPVPTDAAQAAQPGSTKASGRARKG
jgi:diguanylate cyclase (GGDEF)-like protein